MSVRPARAEDLAAVVALERTASEAPHWSVEVYREIATATPDGGAITRRIFVCDSPDGIRGFAVGMVLGAGGTCAGEIENVVVDASARRGGIGRELCAAVVAWCRAAGATAVRLEVRASSAGTIALYTGLGFRVVGRRPAYYQAPVEDAILMELAPA